MTELWGTGGGLRALYLRPCWGMLGKFWEGDPPCIGLCGDGPGKRMPWYHGHWLGAWWRVVCCVSFSTCIWSWASVLCLCCWGCELRNPAWIPSGLWPGFICWKDICCGPLTCGPLGWRAGDFSTTREPETGKTSRWNHTRNDSRADSEMSYQDPCLKPKKTIGIGNEPSSEEHAQCCTWPAWGTGFDMWSDWKEEGERPISNPFHLFSCLVARCSVNADSVCH